MLTIRKHTVTTYLMQFQYTITYSSMCILSKDICTSNIHHFQKLETPTKTSGSADSQSLSAVCCGNLSLDIGSNVDKTTEKMATRFFATFAVCIV